MRFFGLGSSGPYMSSDRRLPNPRPDLLTATRFQIVPGTRGVPIAQVDLTFRRTLPVVANPDMTLAVLLDRSGSMTETYRDRHAYNVAAAIYNHVAPAGIGYDLVFYDDRVTYAGPMRSLEAVRDAVKANAPKSGGTVVTDALKGAIKRYKTRRGLYLIVITDGEFSDKTAVQHCVLHEMLPQVTPDNPYAFRIHFVGAGEGADHGFLQQIEAAATGQGVSLISQHHHAHLSHSHTSILDEIDRALLGVGTDARFGDPARLADASAASPSDITHTSEPISRRTWDGPVGTLGFLPRRARLGVEYGPHAARVLSIGVGYEAPIGASAQRHHEQLMLEVPLPQGSDALSDASPNPLQPSRKPGFHLPWITLSPEAAQQRAELNEKVAQTRQAEQIRQRHDLTALAQGGLPQEATERLKEIGSSDADGILFTSNLDPDEAALLRREGFRVRGLVSGSAMYHVGQSYASSQNDCEVKVLSDAYNEATDLAVGRMRQELKLIGAHGVVGVRLSLVRHEWADKTVEVQVIGTAVEGPGRPPADPWLCDLSGPEWWALYRAGYEPAALVWGHCTWFVLTTAQDEWIKQKWSNQEFEHWSKALSTARHRALDHLTKQARQHRATGITGVRFERRVDEMRLTGPGSDPAYEREHHDLVVSIIGTAIRIRPGATSTVAPTLPVLSLRDGRFASLSAITLGGSDTKIE